MSLEQQHPFALSASELEAVLNSSAVDSSISSSAEESSLPAVTEMMREQGDVTTLAIGEEGGELPPPIIEEEEDGTTERMGEEGGMKPRELPEVTTMALGEEGGELLPPDFPDPTGILAEEGGFVANPEVIATIDPVGEDDEGSELPPPDFPDPTGILAEQGGFISDPLPLANIDPGAEEDEDGAIPPREFPDVTEIIPNPEIITITQALGEEGDFGLTEVLAEQGEVVTEPGEEQGGIITRAEGEDGETVITFAEGEDGGIFDLGEPIDATTLALGEEGGNVGDFEVTEVAEVQTLGGIQDDGNFEVMTDAVGMEGGELPEQGLPDPVSILADGVGVVMVDPPELVTTEALGEEGGFNEFAYVELYPAINEAFQQQQFALPSEHYIRFGQFEPDRIGVFSGTGINDIIGAFGNNNIITGVDISGYDTSTGNFVFGTNGAGEIDVLIGDFSTGDNSDRFLLGESQSQPFYVGFGSSDFALIQNFDIVGDEILLAGAIGDYSFETVNNSTNISTVSGDLIAIVENVPNLQNATISFLG